MKLDLKLCAVFCAFVGINASAQTFLLPSDIKTEKPSAEVPAPCARFFSETGWGQGNWGGVLPNQVWLERINPDCSVQVLYAWGNAPTWRIAAGYSRVNGVIVDNQLSFVLSEGIPKVSVTYTMTEDGQSLRGIWKREGPNGSQTQRVQLIQAKPGG